MIYETVEWLVIYVSVKWLIIYINVQQKLAKHPNFYSRINHAVLSQAWRDSGVSRQRHFKIACPYGTVNTVVMNSGPAASCVPLCGILKGWKQISQFVADEIGGSLAHDFWRDAHFSESSRVIVFSSARSLSSRDLPLFSLTFRLKTESSVFIIY